MSYFHVINKNFKETTKNATNSCSSLSGIHHSEEQKSVVFFLVFLAVCNSISIQRSTNVLFSTILVTLYCFRGFPQLEKKLISYLMSCYQLKFILKRASHIETLVRNEGITRG